MSFKIGSHCQIHPSAVINVESGFLGAGSIVNEGARIEGTKVEIGREAYIDRFATIGGGSCFDPGAFLKAGDWFHMGVQSQINTASGVTVGHELGCGIETKIFTHGAYLDAYNLGAPSQWGPVTLGDSVWLPNAWINPGVTIGSYVVVAARSLVNKDIPSGSLAGGAPCKVLRADYFPRELSLTDKLKLVDDVFQKARLRAEKSSDSYSGTFQFNPEVNVATLEFEGQKTVFNLKLKTIEGAHTPFASLFKDQLRRNGLRFRYRAQNSGWSLWGPGPLEYF